MKLSSEPSCSSSDDSESSIDNDKTRRARQTDVSQSNTRASVPGRAEDDLTADFQNLSIAGEANGPNVGSRVSAGDFDSRSQGQQQQPEATIDQSSGRTYQLDTARLHANALAKDKTSEAPAETDVAVTTAEPVVQETIHVQHHEIKQEAIHRDIHEYHEVTRIQPVLEKVTLPAKHFVMTPAGQKIEVDAADIEAYHDLGEGPALTSSVETKVSR